MQHIQENDCPDNTDYYYLESLKEQAFNELLEGDDFYTEYNRRPISITNDMVIEHYNNEIAVEVQDSILNRLRFSATAETARAELNDLIEQCIHEVIEIYVV